MKIIRPMTPLRRRILEDMQIRNYSPQTIDGYLRLDKLSDQLYLRVDISTVSPYGMYMNIRSVRHRG